MLTYILSGLVPAAALAGTACFARRAFRLPAALCPAVGLACQVLALYTFALAGLLRPGVWAVTLFGLAALAWAAFRDGRALRAGLLEPGTAFLCLYVLFEAVYNGQLVLFSFDNYTHWAVIVKEMYLTNALPQAGTMVIFTNYPPAAALYEYCLTQFLGFGHWQMVLAMNVLEGTMAASLFTGARWRDWRNLLPRLAVAFGTLTVITEHFRSLYVDTLLGLVLLAMGVIALWDGDLSKGAALPQAMLGAFLILTKISGAFLLLLHAGLLLLLKYRRPERPPVRRRLLVLAGVCGGAYLSFALHVRSTFGAALSNNQFRLSLANFAQKLQDKSPEFWVEFPRAMAGAFTSPYISCGRFFVLVNLLLLALFLAVRLGKVRLPPQARGIIPFSWGCAAVYSLFLAAMYILLMDEGEGVAVAGFDRYFGTLMIYQLGLPFAALLLDPEEDPFAQLSLPRWGLSFGALACCVLLAGRLVWAPLPRQEMDRLNQTAANAKALAAAGQVENLLQGERPPVLVCLDYSRCSQDLIYYVTRYAFRQTHVWPFSPEFWTERFHSEPCYILWLEPYGWAEEALSKAGIAIPEEFGLYYKDGDNQLSLVREVIV